MPVSPALLAHGRLGSSSVSGAANRLTVSNGGVLQARTGDVGLIPTSSNNVAVVTGSGSLWSNALELVLGFDSPGNQLVISNGGMVRNGVGYIGTSPSANNNLVVTGPRVGLDHRRGATVVSAAPWRNQLHQQRRPVVNTDGFIGFNAASRDNTSARDRQRDGLEQSGDEREGSGSDNVLIASNGAVVADGMASRP